MPDITNASYLAYAAVAFARTGTDLAKPPVRGRR
jgi:hypothetical protein